jgi:hypothetical protein
MPGAQNPQLTDRDRGCHGLMIIRAAVTRIDQYSSAKLRGLSGGHNRTGKFVNRNQAVRRLPPIIYSRLPFSVALKRHHDDKL